MSDETLDFSVPVSFSLRGHVLVRARTKAEAEDSVANGFVMFNDSSFSATDPRCKDWIMGMTPVRTIGHQAAHLWVLATDDECGTRVVVAHTEEEIKALFCDWVARDNEDFGAQLRLLDFESQEWHDKVAEWELFRDPMITYSLEHFHLPLK